MIPWSCEAKVNNTIGQAQAIKLPCVVAGRIEALEDVDYFKFDAKEGEVVTFEMFCARLQDKIHDLQKHAKPMLTLYDADGRELAANDHFYFADPLLSHTHREDRHLLRAGARIDLRRRPALGLRPARHQQPYVSHVFPMAGNPGKTIDVEPIGSAKLVQPKVPLRVPDELGVQQVQLDVGGAQDEPGNIPGQQPCRSYRA